MTPHYPNTERSAEELQFELLRKAGPARRTVLPTQRHGVEWRARPSTGFILTRLKTNATGAS